MTADVQDGHAEARRTLTEGSSLCEIHQRAVQLAVELVPGTEIAGLSRISRREVSTLAATDELAVRADQVEQELREGPLFEAIRRQVVVYVDDIAREVRWPNWSQRMVTELGLRSMLSFQLLTTDNLLESLNLYSSAPDAFDLDAVNSGYLHAAHVGLAISGVRQQEHLQSAITSRTIIGQAEGILMERYGLTGDAAFNTLRRVSQARNVKVRDLAEELITSGRLEGLTADGPEEPAGLAGLSASEAPVLSAVEPIETVPN